MRGMLHVLLIISPSRSHNFRDGLHSLGFDFVFGVVTCVGSLRMPSSCSMDIVASNHMSQSTSRKPSVLQLSATNRHGYRCVFSLWQPGLPSKLLLASF